MIIYTRSSCLFACKSLVAKENVNKHAYIVCILQRHALYSVSIFWLFALQGNKWHSVEAIPTEMDNKIHELLDHGKSAWNACVPEFVNNSVVCKQLLEKAPGNHS